MPDEIVKAVARFRNHGRTSAFRDELIKAIANLEHMELMELGIALFKIIQEKR